MNKYLVELQTLNKINKRKHETQIQLPIAAQIKCKSMHEMFGDRDKIRSSRQTMKMMSW